MAERILMTALSPTMEEGTLAGLPVVGKGGKSPGDGGSDQRGALLDDHGRPKGAPPLLPIFLGEFTREVDLEDFLVSGAEKLRTGRRRGSLRMEVRDGGRADVRPWRSLLLGRGMEGQEGQDGEGKHGKLGTAHGGGMILRG